MSMVTLQQIDIICKARIAFYITAVLSMLHLSCVWLQVHRYRTTSSTIIKQCSLGFLTSRRVLEREKTDKRRQNRPDPP